MLVYTVKRGDTLWQIAKEYQISLDALLAANPHIGDPNYILPGSRINVPRLAQQPEEAKRADTRMDMKIPPELLWEQESMLRQEAYLREEAMMGQEEVAREEELMRRAEEQRRQEELMRHEEELRRQENLMRHEEELRRQDNLMRHEEELRRQDNLMRHEEELRRQENLMRHEEELRRQEEQRSQENLMQQQTYTYLQAEEPGCCINGARPCVYITTGGETLHGISEEWGIPLAQLHYHNYYYAPGSQLPGGERIIIPRAHDYRIHVDNSNRNRGMRARRRR